MVKNILVVDDSVTDRTHLESVLSSAGYMVQTAMDGSQALDAAKNVHADLILMDVNMPGMDGFATTRQLKNDNDTKDIPIIFVSAKNQKADKAWGQMLGAKGYITKPYSDDDVLNQIQSL